MKRDARQGDEVASSAERNPDAGLSARIIERFREQGLAEVLRGGLKSIVYRAHYHLHDRRFERHEAVSTAGMVEAAALDVDPGYRRHSSEYLPTPRLLVDWLVQATGQKPQDYSFVDIGCGRGRVVLTAAAYPFRQVLGIELSPSLHADAIRNIREGNFASAEVRALCDDAIAAPWPVGPALFFLFNPFDRDISQRFLERFATRAQTVPPDYLLLLNFKYPDLVDAEQFEEVPLPLKQRLALRWLSPYPVAIYRRRAKPAKA